MPGEKSAWDAASQHHAYYAGLNLKLLLYKVFFFRDGQYIGDDAVGGVITNLHLPRDWSIFEQLHSPLPGRTDSRGEDFGRVHFAIGCHPKQAALLTTPMLKRLDALVRRPGVVAVGECGLDYSARSFADRASSRKSPCFERPENIHDELCW